MTGMRKFAVLMATAMALVVGMAPAEAASPSIQIKYDASPIYQYDASPDGDGSGLQPATNVGLVFWNCPAGEYQFDAVMWQDGRSMSWTGGGLGQGEFYCDGTTQRVTRSWGFTGETLHAGRAWVRVGLRKVVCDDQTGVCTTEDTPTVWSAKFVRIPSGT